MTAASVSGPERAFAASLKRERTERRLRQEDLAQRLAASGLNLHQSAIAKIEIGARMIRLGEARVIAQALGLSVEQMTSSTLGADVGRDVDVWSALRGRVRAAGQSATPPPGTPPPSGAAERMRAEIETAIHLGESSGQASGAILGAVKLLLAADGNTGGGAGTGPGGGAGTGTGGGGAGTGPGGGAGTGPGGPSGPGVAGKASPLAVA